MNTIKGACESCGHRGGLNWHERAKKFLCVLCYKLADIQ